MRWKPSIAALLLLASVDACDFSALSTKPLEVLPANPDEERSASRAVSEFLEALDAGGPASAWPLVGESFRQGTAQTLWETGISGMRAAVGTPIHRTALGSAYTEAMPDAPPGRYFIFEFETEFSNATVTERVVPIFERNKWRVVGYHLIKQFGTQSAR